MDDHLRRVVDGAGGEEVLETLSRGLGGADLTTLLLEVMHRRAEAVTPAHLAAAYPTDRFTAPAPVPYAALRMAEDRMLEKLPAGCETVQLAPLVPLGTHAALGDVHQNNVVSTVRRTEAAADTTAGLALEAARRRRELLAGESRSSESVRLAAVQRVVRAQRYGGEQEWAHFTLLGVVTAGRDAGNLDFEQAAAVEHCAYAASLGNVGAEKVTIEVSDFGGGAPVIAAVRDAVAAEVVEASERTAGRGYYDRFAYRALVRFGDDRFDVTDGGFVDWTQRLLGSRKERLMIGGTGLDRLAAQLG